MMPGTLERTAARHLGLFPESFRERFALAAFDDGGVLVDVETGSYFQLDASAARICSIIDSVQTRSRAIEAISETLRIDEPTATAAVENVMTALSTRTPRRDPDGPFRYERRGDGYALLESVRPVVQIDSLGSKMRVRPEGSSFGLLEYIRGVTPKILALQGTIVLHASAVLVEGRVVAMSGSSGSGKTTTAKALVRAGAELISEDLVILTLGPDSVRVVSRGEGMIREWQAQALAALSRSPEQSLSCQRLREVVDGPTATLERILFLSAERRRGDAFEQEPLTRPDALRLLVENSFIGSVEPSRWRFHLNSARHIAEVVSTSSVWVPNGIDRLADAAGNYMTICAS